MTFVDLNFWIFFAVVLFLYSFFNLRWKQALLLIASVAFYGSLNVKFLIPLFAILLSDYICGLLMASRVKENLRKYVLFAGVAINLVVLFYFKIPQSLVEAINEISHLDMVKPLRPIGVSFYMFQSISYLVDVYDRKIPTEKNFFKYILYVTFFPQLVVGPIEQAGDLIPQLNRLKMPTQLQLNQGIHYIVIGLLKKVLLADRLQILLNENPIGSQSSIYKLFWCCQLFNLRVYLDFSGYSDIAKGLALMFGVEIQRNFRPYIFAENAGDYWNRWHISFKNWIQKYLYKKINPLPSTQSRTVVAIFITFLMGAIWHEMSFYWLAFGLFNAVSFLGFFYFRQRNIKVPKTLGRLLMIGFFFALGYFTYGDQHRELFHNSLSNLKNWQPDQELRAFIGISLWIALPAFVYDFFNEKNEYPLLQLKPLARYIFYVIAIFLIVIFNRNYQSFEYFKF